ncbi:MAG TPA: hypothetical protein VIV35_11070 [Chitinophagaceae bacterium]
MKIHHLLPALLSLVSTALPAQTKKIAFESHSGNLENFSIALGNELFDKGESDYGLPANKTAYKLDSVIFISDTVSILVSKAYTRPWSAKSDSLDKLVGVKKDTIYNDPLFSRIYLLDSIKKMVDNRGLYETTNKTKFIGFDNKKSPVKKTGDKQQLTPFAITNDPPDDQPPFDIQLALMLGTILLLSLLGGWLSWRFYQPRLQPRGV